MHIKDRVALGTMAGIIGTVPQVLLNYMSYNLGFSKYYSFQLAAGVHVAKHLVDKTSAFVLGGIIWELTGAVLGILIVYFIRATGKSYWWLKGVLVPNVVMYTFIFGLIWDMGGSKVVAYDIGTTSTELLGNTIFGITTAYFVKLWGEDLPNKPL